MIVLHESNETAFNNWGLGILSDAINPEVVEELNGQFYMEMQYPIDGNNYQELKVDRLLRMDASQRLKDQRFKIVRIVKKPNELVHVYAEHISNHTADLQLKPDVAFNGNAHQVLNQWSTGIVTEHPFEVYSNITSTKRGVWEHEKVANARQALGGVEHSVLDMFGGEYLFDNYKIRLVKQRGVYNDVPILYGKNLVDLDQEEQIANTYTSVMPFATYQPEGEDEPETLTLPEYYIDSEHVNLYARRKIQRVDFTSEDITTVDSLRKRTEQYIKDNDVGIPNVSLKVQFIELSKTVDYAGIAQSEAIGMGDRVVVRFEKLGVSQRAKVITTRFNPVTKQYNEIEVGELRAGLTDSIETVVGGQVDRIDKDINRVQMRANGKNKIFRGNNRPTKGVSKNDLWYRPVGDNQVEVYQFDGGSWKLIIHEGMNDEIRQALAEAEENIEDARKNTEDLEMNANSILAGLGVKPIGTYHTETVGYIRENVKDRIDHVEELEDGTRRIIAEIKRNPEGELVGYQTIKETTSLYERVIGGTSAGEEGVRSNVARVVMADNIFRTEVVNEITSIGTSVTQLESSWALRIENNDGLVSAINASDKGVYIKGKDITFDGQVYSSGDFTITGDMIADTISATKIKGGRFDGYEMVVVNIDVDSLVGNKSNFVSSSWNSAVGGSVSIDGTGISTIASDRSEVKISNGLMWVRNSAGSNLGQFGYMNNVGNITHNVAIRTSYGTGFVLNQTYDSSSRRKDVITSVIDTSGQATVSLDARLRMNGEGIYLSEWNLQASGSLRRVGNTVRLVGPQGGAGNSVAIYGATSGNSIKIGYSLQTYSNGGITNKFWADLDMSGNSITNQSDIRLKENVVDSELNALREIDRLRFIEWEWKKNHPRTDGMPSGKHFGIQAQYSPFLQTKGVEESYLSVDMTKQVSLNSKAIQELHEEVKRLEELVNEQTTTTNSN